MQTEVVENGAQHRFEVHVDGRLAGFTAYQSHPGGYTFTHTEIDPEDEGKGVGSTLVRGVLDEMRRRGLTVRPVCPFVLTFLRRHPDYVDLVPALERARFGLPPARERAG